MIIIILVAYLFRVEIAFQYLERVSPEDVKPVREIIYYKGKLGYYYSGIDSPFKEVMGAIKDAENGKTDP